MVVYTYDFRSDAQTARAFYDPLFTPEIINGTLT